MSTELTCPDCGGVIGGDSNDPGRACTCWSESAKVTGLASEATDSGDTVVDRVAPAATKVCCQCGKDLAGKKRLRDSRGYWCYACHKLDQEATRPQGKRCDECNRKVPETALSEIDGKQICGKCQLERKQAEKDRRRLSPVKTDAHDQLAKKRLLWILAVVVVLTAIIVLKQMKVIGS